MIKVISIGVGIFLIIYAIGSITMIKAFKFIERANEPSV